MSDGRSDGALVAASLRGDRSAFAVLVRRHRPQAAGVAARMLGDREEAEDVAQEAVLRAHLALSELREPERFGAWLCGIAVNVARMALRRRRASVPLDDEAGGRHRPAWAVERSAEQAVEALEELRLVQRAVEVLPDGQRDVVLMHYVNGLPTQDIAALLGRSPGAVRVSLHRARAQLRELLPAFSRKETRPMVAVELKDVVVSVLPNGEGGPPRLDRRVIVLQETGGARILAIWVGSGEGDALALQLASDLPVRPMTADLMARLLEVAGTRVQRVVISRLAEETFYAIVTVAVDSRTEDVDARPSDALNLAARVGAPIYVDEEVLAQAGVSPEDDEGLFACLDEKEGERPREWRPLSPELVRSQASWQRKPKEKRKP